VAQGTDVISVITKRKANVSLRFNIDLPSFKRLIVTPISRQHPPGGELVNEANNSVSNLQEPGIDPYNPKTR
jgi:hypothetical protein